MRTRAIIITATLLAALSACGADADPAACKTAMAEQFDKTMAAGDKAEEAAPPAACDGVDDKTLERLVGEVTDEWMKSDKGRQHFEGAVDGAIESAVPEPTATQLPDECRAWIEDELLDSSGSIDAADGYGVCGDLSDEELDQAIDDVTNDLIEQGATAP